ncbi:MAG TPA: YdeI/OmpD-associated family protein [Verrucomicrobiae bacterium]|nr:YdeI/OmpD-associated family protein [Verrucomicrobiae bacterium]
MKPLAFKSSAEFRSWLEENHADSDGVWLRIYKKDSGEKSITYAEALDQALCFGWIDGQKKAFDEISWIQKFTPRRAKSGWSKLNTEHAERLIKAGQMTRAGLEAVEAAKLDGRWKAAYDSPRNAAPPEDFLQALGKDNKAKAFFETLNRANIYAIVYRLQTAKKPETREKRMKMILEMLARGEKFHP